MRMNAAGIVPASPALAYEPLTVAHTDGLAALLLNEEVYRFIGGQPPTLERFRLGMQRAIAGPPPERAGQEWINFAVRRQDSGELLGRLEATVHDGLAEVAFLFGPAHWGKGYAAEGLRWLGRTLSRRPDRPALWATTLPLNLRCQALLRRCGYEQVAAVDLPRLLTYDEGDLVFRWRGA